ncbi:MAG: ATP cone domain-containing protein [Methanomicrobiales archaeon]|nr:ATP cone domain-containing protein [Methanomicrobiales archaeon]
MTAKEGEEQERTEAEKPEKHGLAPRAGESPAGSETGEQAGEVPAERVKREIESGGGGEFGRSVRAGWEARGERRTGEQEEAGRAPETVMPGGSPESYTKPWNVEEAQPSQGASEELTVVAEKLRSGGRVSRSEVGSLDTQKTGYEGELQQASEQEGRYGVTGRSGEQLRTGELKAGPGETREGTGIVQEQARTREGLQKIEMGTEEEREKRAREGLQLEKSGCSVGTQSGGREDAEIRRSIRAGEIPAEGGMRLAEGEDPRRQEEYVSPAFQALTGAGERIQILREDGSVEAFNPEKISRALEGAGATSEEAREIARRVESGISTSLTAAELDDQVRAQVRRVNPEIERHWNAYRERFGGR